jgi:hypothetical protein
LDFTVSNGASGGYGAGVFRSCDGKLTRHSFTAGKCLISELQIGLIPLLPHSVRRIVKRRKDV